MLCDICRCVAEFQSLFHFLSLCLELLAHQNSMLNLAQIRPVNENDVTISREVIFANRESLFVSSSLLILFHSFLEYIGD